MRILSWNVNGLRAVVRKEKWDDVFELGPDILCLQETKAHPDQLPEDNHTPNGYEAYFSSSQVRKGYSGVAVYTTKTPNAVHEGMGIKAFDEQGRLLTLEFDGWVLINGYFPNGASKTASLAYKLDFYDEFLAYIENYRSKGFSIVFGGDLNVAHEEIDIARPEANKNHTGFLPEERAWVDELIHHGYIDTFRHTHPSKQVFSYWDLQSRARDRNVGWRIDYWFISPELLPKLKSADIYGNIYGSDHAPVGIDIELN